MRRLNPQRRLKSSVLIPGIVAGLLVVGLNRTAGQSGYPRAGWETHFTQLGHGVRGTATILDERTIRLTHFSYDGLAPDMYVYLATNRTTAAFLNGGLTASPRLARAYNNETYLVQLPAGQTLDSWNAISIWCRAVQASFGWGTFAPPVRPTLAATPLPNAVEVKLTGEAGQKYWLAGSTNLLDTNAWQTIVLLTNTTGTVRYTNSSVNQHPVRFFRSVRD